MVSPTTAGSIAEAMANADTPGDVWSDCLHCGRMDASTSTSPSMHFRARLLSASSVVLGFAAFAATIPLHAQSTLFWDLNGFTAGSGGGTAPSGIWNMTDARWCVVADGAGPVVPWINNSIAVFSAGTNATGAYTVTLTAANLPVGGLQFQEGTTTLTGAGTLQFVNPATGITPQVALNGQPAAIGAGVTLAGSAGLNFVGTGTLTLAGATTTTGPTMIDGITLRLAAANRLSDASPLQLLGELDLAGFDETVGTLSGDGEVSLGTARLTISTTSDSTFAGAISGTGSVWKSGAGRLTLTQAAGWSGATRVQAGTLTLGANNTFPDAADLVVDGGATFDLENHAERIGTITGSGTVHVTNSTFVAGTATSFTFDGAVAGTGSFEKRGTGRMTLSKAGSFTGAIHVPEGTLRLAADQTFGATSSINVAGGTLELAGSSQRFSTLYGTSSVQLQGGTLTLDATTTLDAALVGPGTLVKAGPYDMIFRRAFDAVDALVVQEGEFSADLAGPLGTGLDVSVAAGATFQIFSTSQIIGRLTAAGRVDLQAARLTIAGTGSSLVSGTISGDGGITKSGTGTLTLSGANTYVAPTEILGGTVRLAGTQRLPNGASASVAAGAVLELAGPPDGAYQLFGAVTGDGDLRATGVHDTISFGEGDVSAPFAGRLRGAGNFRKDGLGTVTLSGASDATGELILLRGILRAGADQSFPAQNSGAVTVAPGSRLELAGHTQRLHGLIDGGTVDLGGGTLILTGASMFAGTVTGVGGLEKEGATTDTLSGLITFSGPTRVRAGTLRIDRSAVIDTDAQIDAGATLDVSGRNVGLNALAGAGTLNCADGQFSVGGANADFAFAGALLGNPASRISKLGTGRFTLSGTTNIEDLQLAGGTLALGGDERLIDSSVLTLASGATLDLSHYDETISRVSGNGTIIADRGTLNVGAGGFSSTFAATMTGTGAFGKLGTGIVTLSGELQKSGGVSIHAGLLRLAVDERISDSTRLTLSTGAAFDLAGFDETLASLTGTGEILLPASSTLAVGAGNLSSVFAASVFDDGTLQKLGTGTLTFSGQTEGLLRVLVSGGTLQLGVYDPFDWSAALTIEGGAVFETQQFRQRFASLAGTGTIQLGALGDLSIDAGNFSGAITGPGAFRKLGDGTLTLSGVVNFPGYLEVARGTLALTAAGTTTLTTATLSVQGRLSLASGVTLGGALYNDGQVILGSGGPPPVLTAAIAGRGTFQGAASLGGSYNPGGFSNPTWIGSFDGPVKLLPSHTLQLELGGVTPGGAHDQLSCAGALTLGGKLEVTLRNGFVPAGGNSFQLLQAASFAGTFSQLQLPPLAAGMIWDTSRLGVDGTLRVLSGYAAWIAGFGLDPATNGAPNANPSGDGVPNLLKFLLGGNPLVAQTGLLPASGVEFAGGTTTLVFSYERDVVASMSLGDEYVELTTDLVTWTRVVPNSNGVKQSIVSLERSREVVTLRIPVSTTRVFVRLKAEF